MQTAMKLRQRHAHHAGAGRNDGPQRAHETASHHAFRTMLAKKLCATAEHARIACERPHFAQLTLVAVTNPEAEHVATERTQRAPDPHRQRVGHAQADQRTDTEQDENARQEETHHHHGLDKGDQEYRRADQPGVGGDPVRVNPVTSRLPSVCPLRNDLRAL